MYTKPGVCLIKPSSSPLFQLWTTERLAVGLRISCVDSSVLLCSSPGAPVPRRNRAVGAPRAESRAHVCLRRTGGKLWLARLARELNGPADWVSVSRSGGLLKPRDVTASGRDSLLPRGGLSGSMVRVQSSEAPRLQKLNEERFSLAFYEYLHSFSPK